MSALDELDYHSISSALWLDYAKRLHEFILAPGFKRSLIRINIFTHLLAKSSSSLSSIIDRSFRALRRRFCVFSRLRQRDRENNLEVGGVCIAGLQRGDVGKYRREQGDLLE
ncbi:unnamed protein product [Timema podura]|uniref:Maturase K n=1 Tax=Timema podura TaxID=61482 RepID=A0ABN7NL07_TIMPD|nr:unnamed protein product [Timema podura]